MKRKSELDRQPFRGRRVCQRESVGGEKCHARATVSLTIRSFPIGTTTELTSTSLLCDGHADAVVAAYQNEWERHPEYFA
jgi:hypothetical protein